MVQCRILLNIFKECHTWDNGLSACICRSVILPCILKVNVADLSYFEMLSDNAGRCICAPPGTCSSFQMNYMMIHEQGHQKEIVIKHSFDIKLLHFKIV